MSSEEPENNVQADARWKRVAVYAAVLLGVFLLGLVPMWLAARGRAQERDAAQHALRLSRIESSLASAVIDARRGEYEPARQAASSFFTSLREQVDAAAAGDRSDLTSAQLESVRPLFDQRDLIITLLAERNPAAGERLSDLYVSYRKAMGGALPEAGK